MYWHCKYYDENQTMQFAHGYSQESLDKFKSYSKKNGWLIKLPTLKITKGVDSAIAKQRNTISSGV